AHLRQTGVADEAYFGPELEFFVFDQADFHVGPTSSAYFVGSAESGWSADGDGAGLAHRVRDKEGYSQVPPVDSMNQLRWAVSHALESIEIPVELHHHEVASGGQSEIAMAHSTLLKKADQSQWYRYLVRNIASRQGQIATFMPKPVYGDNGSGMHTHQSLWRESTPLFHDSNGYAGLSRLARHYIGGLLAHAPALLAFTSPSTNSYKRLLPGYEAPVYLAYSMGNRSAAVRAPAHARAPQEKRVEF